LETLGLRMREHCKNAMRLAKWLQQQPAVETVYYPGLATHPQHALAARMLDDFGGVVSFTVRGGRPAAWRVIDSTKLLSITANLGDAKTTITHPASTTHARITADERARAGIGDDLIRISAGLELSDDIIDDLRAGLQAI